MKKNILVSGATGTQGGSVVRALLEKGYNVTGITRNTKSEKAKKLSEQGVKLVSVDFSETEKLVKIMGGFDSVFSMTTPFEGGMEAEIQQGINMANAAHKAGVGHFVFNSVGDADQQTGIPHFDSKYEVEKHLKTLEMPFTIVAPAYFMDNIYFPFTMDSLKQGVLKMAMPAWRKLQQIAVEDIGNFVGRVITEREKWFGKRINISGDELSGDEAASILSKVSGKDIRYEGFPPEYMRAQSEDMALMYEWFDKSGYTAKLNDLKPFGFLSFEEWANKQSWPF